jgi:Phage tail sheath protein subtilisin-like domain/Phage tail sheath C-terminal domain
MAILQGFPPSSTISPSVRITERDLSYTTTTQSLHRAGLIGFASKGPVNLPTLVATNRQLTTVFGNPHPDVSDPFLIYAAQQYLLVANELYIVRVADVDPVSDEQAITASVQVPAAGTLVEIESATAGPYTFDMDSFFRWRLNNILSPKTLVAMAAPTGINTSDLVDELNSQLDFENDGIMFYLTDPNNINSPIGVKTLWAYGPDASLELVSQQDSLYGYNGPTGLGTGMESAVVTGTMSMYPDTAYNTAGTFDLTGLSGLNIQVVIDGSDNVLVDGIVQNIDLGIDGANVEGSSQNITDIVTAINTQITNNLPGGFEAVVVGNNIKFSTNHSGRDARIRIKPDSTALDIFGLDTLTHVGVSPTMMTGEVGVETAGIVQGASNTTGAVSFTFTADSPGIDGNATQVVIANDVRQNHFSVQVINNGVPVESWGNLTKNQSSSYYVETYLSLVSDYIRVVDNTSNGAGPLNGVYQLGDTTMGGMVGSDGIPADPDVQDSLLIGSQIGYTGLYTLSEPEQIDIDLIAIPGHSSTNVVLALLDFCQNIRKDCLAIIDPPFGLTVSEIVAWQNGTHPLNLTRFDSDFGALYWPWVKIRDTFNKVDVWVPPSGSIMAVIAQSDYLSNPWFAPAGTTRGVVPNITDVYNRPTLVERDLMYGNRNCINPIVNFNNSQGFIVWGQKTLQRTPTALDRVSVRRLMFYLEKNIIVASRDLLFDPNDDTFRNKFTTLASSILQQVQAARGLYAYIIKADTELNTPDVIDRNEFRAQIGVQPVRAAEFMFIEFSIHRTGSFTENASTLY